MFAAEIVIAETKPDTEWVRGRALQKTSPTYWHGLVQRRVSAALGTYLRSGTRVVLVIDPMRKTAVACDASGDREFDASASFVHAAFEGLAISIARLFEET